MNIARLILDTPATGRWNMAVDEALLQSAADTGRLTLRIYAWSEPTLSLGYFQRYQERECHAASRTCAAVRRATGGGAILHHHDVTYSLTAPVRNRADRQLSRWYDLVHDAWRDAFAGLGVPTYRCPQTDPQRERQFLCFERRAAGDLLLDSTKIGGSAQRRLPQAALQHGSLLLKRSPAAPELPGFAELTGREWHLDAWLEAWTTALAGALRVVWQPSGLTDQEVETAAGLEHSRFGNVQWTLRR
ncbi:MAG: lipoate--protein ligase family protein [Pirellulaceae bacterium]